jgi:peptide deformylase
MDDDKSDSIDSLSEETIEMYHEFYRMAMTKCSNGDHSGVAVAGTMIGIALRLYRTAMDDSEYAQMMGYLFENVDLIEPYKLGEFESATVH